LVPAASAIGERTAALVVAGDVLGHLAEPAAKLRAGDGFVKVHDFAPDGGRRRAVLSAWYPRGGGRCHRVRLVELCGAAGLTEPDLLADELHLLLEGARVTAQSVGTDGLGARLVRMGEAMIAAHSSD
jgi:hypothetical protein